MPTQSFNTTFNAVTKTVSFTDTSGFPGQGIALVDIVGNFKITAPSGTVVYNNTSLVNASCDIDFAVSLTSQQTISLPLLTSGLIEPGLYTIEYNVWDSNNNLMYTDTQTYTFTYISPVVCIEQDVDCLSPLFTSTDTTVYTVDTIVPTKVEVHTINYPFGSAGQGAPTIGSALVVTSSTFYNGTQTSTVSSTLTYVYPDGLIISDVVTGAEEVLVDCTDICAIYCCIRSVERAMYEYKTTNRTKYAEWRLKFDDIMGYASMVALAIRCGKSTEVNGLLEKIREIGDCTEDCGCSDGDPVQVTGLGGLINDIVVTSGGSPVVVTSVTVGNTVTYTVTISTAFVNLVNSLYNTVVVAGNNVTVTGPVVAGVVHTYTVNALKATVGSTNGSVVVTPGAVVLGVQNYDLAVDLDSVVEATEAGTPFSVTGATNDLTVTGALGLAAVAGTYLIIWEGDALDGGGGVDCSLALYKTGAVVISGVRELRRPVTGGIQGTLKIVCTAIAVLAAGNTVSLVIDNFGALFTIRGRSIVMVKIA